MLFIDASDKLRRERLKLHENVRDDQYEEIMSVPLEQDAEKIKSIADVVIVNDSSKQKFHLKIDDAVNPFLKNR